MDKNQAIAHFGSLRKLAAALGISPQAVSAWPDTLTPRQAHEVLGAMIADADIPEPEAPTLPKGCHERGVEYRPATAKEVAATRATLSKQDHANINELRERFGPLTLMEEEGKKCED